MSTENNETAARLRVLAEQVLTMPTAGTIEAGKALALMGEAVNIIQVLLAESSRHIDIGTEMTKRCHQLYDHNIGLLIDRAMERPAATA